MRISLDYFNFPLLHSPLSCNNGYKWVDDARLSMQNPRTPRTLLVEGLFCAVGYLTGTALSHIICRLTCIGACESFYLPV